MKERVQFYILSRDRPNFLKDAVDSVLNQNPSLVEFDLIISDNSENEDVRKMIDRSYATGDLKYIRRKPALSAEEHFRLVVSELSSKFAVLFHDDDVLCPDYMSIMLPLFKKNIVAIGCNGMTFTNSTLNVTGKMHNNLKAKEFDNEVDFLERYLPGGGGIAPYPGYMYLTRYLKQAFLNPSAKGKHSDVIILSSLLNHGNILWSEKSLMYYRVHESNDSVMENIPDRLVLLNYMKSKGIEKNSTNVLFFRILFWLRWMSQQGSFLSNLTCWRYRTVGLSVLFKIIRASGASCFWKIILRRYFRRFRALFI